MAIAQQVNATRMELLKQKKRLAMARRGHKLLKQKRDELMHRFLQLVEETRGLRERVEEKLAAGFRSFLLARAEMSKEAMEESLMTDKYDDCWHRDTTKLRQTDIPFHKPIPVVVGDFDIV
jgi:V/A-type H+-transporting ATPase subunit D